MRICEVTGIRPNAGNKVSHSNRKTRTRWLPNLQNKKYFIPELGRTIQLVVSTRAIRTIDKNGGITPVLMKAKPEKLSPRMRRLQKDIYKQRVLRAQPKAAAKAPKVTKAKH